MFMKNVFNIYLEVVVMKNNLLFKKTRDCS